MEDEVYDLDNPVTIFRFKGSSTREPVPLDLIDAQEAVAAIYKKYGEMEDASDPAFYANWHLDELKKWLVGRGVSGADNFGKAELDALWQGILMAYAKKKHTQKKELEETQT
jgi:hypothetical protein